MGMVIAIACLAVMVIGYILTMVAVFLPKWEVNDISITTNDLIRYHTGLWLKCTSYSTGNWECDDYNMFFLALPFKLQAGRGFAITSLFFGLISCVLCGLTIPKTVCQTESGRRWSRILAAVLSLLSGISIIVAASWVGHDLYQEYNYSLMQAGGNINNVSGGRLMVFGEALYMAWAGGALLIIASILSCARFCSDDDEDDNRRAPYTYKADPRVNTVSKSMTEYV